MGAKISKKGSYNITKREKKSTKSKRGKLENRAASFISLSQAQIYEDEIKSPLPVVNHKILENPKPIVAVKDNIEVPKHSASSKPSSDHGIYSTSSDEALYQNVFGEDAFDPEEQIERRASSAKAETNDVDIKESYHGKRKIWNKPGTKEVQEEEQYFDFAERSSKPSVSEVSEPDAHNSWKDVLNGGYWAEAAPQSGAVHGTVNQNFRNKESEEQVPYENEEKAPKDDKSQFEVLERQRSVEQQNSFNLEFGAVHQTLNQNDNNQENTSFKNIHQTASYILRNEDEDEQIPYKAGVKQHDNPFEESGIEEQIEFEAVHQTVNQNIKNKKSEWEELYQCEFKDEHLPVANMDHVVDSGPVNEQSLYENFNDDTQLEVFQRQGSGRERQIAHLQTGSVHQAVKDEADKKQNVKNDESQLEVSEKPVEEPIPSSFADTNMQQDNQLKPSTEVKDSHNKEEVDDKEEEAEDQVNVELRDQLYSEKSQVITADSIEKIRNMIEGQKNVIEETKPVLEEDEDQLQEVHQATATTSTPKSRKKSQKVTFEDMITEPNLIQTEEQLELPSEYKHRTLSKSSSVSSDMYYEFADDGLEDSEAEEQDLYYDAEEFEDEDYQVEVSSETVSQISSETRREGNKTQSSTDPQTFEKREEAKRFPLAEDAKDEDANVGILIDSDEDAPTVLAWQLPENNSKTKQKELHRSEDEGVNVGVLIDLDDDNDIPPLGTDLKKSPQIDRFSEQIEVAWKSEDFVSEDQVKLFKLPATNSQSEGQESDPLIDIKDIAPDDTKDLNLVQHKVELRHLHHDTQNSYLELNNGDVEKHKVDSTSNHDDFAVESNGRKLSEEASPDVKTNYELVPEVKQIKETESINQLIGERGENSSVLQLAPLVHFEDDLLINISESKELENNGIVEGRSKIVEPTSTPSGNISNLPTPLLDLNNDEVSTKASTDKEKSTTETDHEAALPKVNTGVSFQLLEQHPSSVPPSTDQNMDLNEDFSNKSLSLPLERVENPRNEFKPPSAITTPEEIAEEQMRVWGEQKEAGVEAVISEISKIMVSINDLRVQIDNLGPADADSDTHSEMFQELIRIMRQVNAVNNYNFNERIIELQHTALDDVHACIRNLQSKK